VAKTLNLCLNKHKSGRVYLLNQLKLFLGSAPVVAQDSVTKFTQVLGMIYSRLAASLADDHAGSFLIFALSVRGVLLFHFLFSDRNDTQYSISFDTNATRSPTLAGRSNARGVSPLFVERNLMESRMQGTNNVRPAPTRRSEAKSRATFSLRARRNLSS